MKRHVRTLMTYIASGRLIYAAAVLCAATLQCAPPPSPTPTPTCGSCLATCDVIRVHLADAQLLLPFITYCVYVRFMCSQSAFLETTNTTVEKCICAVSAEGRVVIT